MDERQSFETEVCAACGEEVQADDPQNCWPSASWAVVLCPACAAQHGGVYDPELERWQVPPSLSTLKHRLPEDDC